jgi:hypothetical protein
MRRQFLILLLPFFVFSSCQPQFLDKSGQAKVTSIFQPEVESYVASPVWLTDTKILFSFVSVIDSKNAETIIPDLRFYHVDEEKWEKLSVTNDNNCRILNFSFQQRLPNHNLGFYNTCLSDNGSITSVLQEMDITAGEVKTLLESDFSISVGQFSFSPDMSELIQEDKTGRFLSNKLFYKHGDMSRQILPGFTRAMYPSWSHLERLIAFWGTENYPGDNGEELDTLPEISALALYPFDLYVSSPEGTNIEKIVDAVQDPLFIKWSPTERMIVFAGTFNNLPGIWLVDPATAKVTRIWQRSGEFEWSPDGSKIVIVNSENDEEGKIKKQEINIISVRR